MTALDTRRRSRIEIFVDILEAIADGQKSPTRIMYKANLSWQMLNESLNFLTSNGLLIAQSDNDRTLYSLTEKGFRIVNDFANVRNGLTVQLPAK